MSPLMRDWAPRAALGSPQPHFMAWATSLPEFAAPLRSSC